MGKAERLARTVGAFADESMGARSSAPRPMPKAVVPAQWQGTSRTVDFLKIEVTRISPDPAQPRKVFEEESLQGLADSLGVFGQLQAIRVWYDAEADTYRIVAGERRWRAAKLAGMSLLSCQVVPRPDSDPLRLAAQIAENTARADLAPVERADALAQLLDVHNWTVREIAQRTGLSKTTVATDLTIAKMPDAVRRLVASRDLAGTVALEVARIPHPSDQCAIAADAARDRMSAAAVREWVDKILGKAAPSPEPIERGVSVSGTGQVSTNGDIGDSFRVAPGISIVHSPNRAPVEPSAHDEPPAPKTGATADRGSTAKPFDYWDARGAVHAIPTSPELLIPLLEGALAKAKAQADPGGEAAVDAALEAALKAPPGWTGKWASFRLVGALDDGKLLEAIGNCWESEPCAQYPVAWATKGGGKPAFWIGFTVIPVKKRPTLSGEFLVARARRILNIRRPGQ